MKIELRRFVHKFNKENQRWQFSNDAMKSAAKTAQTWSKVKGKSTIKQFPCRKEFNDKTCICGTDLCKQTMVNYFNNYHDYDWPDKLFPWLHVGIPKWPLDHVRSTTRGSRTLKRANIRAEKVKRRGLFCKHLQLHDSEDFANHNGVVAFPVHFPLIWWMQRLYSYMHELQLMSCMIDTGTESNGNCRRKSVFPTQYTSRESLQLVATQWN